MSGRIRTIKPELLEDSKTASLNHDEWRLFVSLLLVADDHGNFRANPSLLEGLVFHSRAPREALASLLATLSDVGLVVLYDAGGQKYGSIVNWAKHQKVDKPSKPKIPGPYDPLSTISRGPRESLARLSRLTCTCTCTCTSTCTCTGRGTGNAREALAESPPPPPVETMADARALLIGTEAKLELFEHWQSEHHRVWKSDKVLVPPTAALEAAGKVLVHAGGDMAVAKRAVTVLVETREGFWAKQKNALWLLTDARDFERARLSTGAKEKPRVDDIFG